VAVTITSIGGVGDSNVFGSKINNLGQVIGSYENSAGVERSFLWQNGELHDLDSELNISGYYPVSINNRGQIVIVQSVSPGKVGASQIVLLNGNSLTGATVSALAPAPQGTGEPVAINDQGWVVGTDFVGAGSYQPAVWKNGSATDLSIPSGGDPAVLSLLGSVPFAFSSATGVNNSGQIVGTAYTAGAMYSAGCLWQNGSVTVLGLLPGDYQGQALAINNLGIIVGNSGNWHPVTWYNGVITQLPALNSGSAGIAQTTSINDVGMIGGWSDDTAVAAQPQYAVIWHDGSIVNLNTLLPSNSGWDLTSVKSLNDNGQLLVQGYYNGVVSNAVMTIPFSATDAANSTYQNYFTNISVSDSAASVSSNLDALQSLANAGKIASITLTDSGIPTVQISAGQLSNDIAVIKDLSGNFSLSITAPTTATTISGASNALGNTIDFSGTASQYTIIPSGNGTSFSIANGSVIDQVSHVTALKFSDFTDFVASQTPAVAGGISSFQVTTLYAAVLAREPDVAGLAYYENEAANNPGIPITTYAENFLQSPEYTSNTAHNYAQSPAGDAQFITDTYNNLLHRAPEAGAVAWYQANVIAPYLSGPTAGTAAYTNAELAAHAAVLADFSQSAEFQGAVQVTAQNPSSAQHWLILI